MIARMKSRERRIATGELEPGDYTLARIGGGDLRGLFLSEAALLENGQSELRCRTQVRFLPLFRRPAAPPAA